MQIHYAEAPGPGPALVILHGITGALDTFVPLIPILAQQAHVYAIDLRGHNLSGRTPGAYQSARLRAGCGGFSAKGRRPAGCGGGPFPGRPGCRLAGRDRARLGAGHFSGRPTALIITQPPRVQQTLFYGFFTFLRDYLRQHHANGGTLDDMVVFVSQLPVNETQTMLEVAGPEAVRLRADRAPAHGPDRPGPGHRGDHPGRATNPMTCWRRFVVRSICWRPRLSLAGPWMRRMWQRFVAHAPACTHAVLEGAGHGIHEERPAEYVQALQYFLAAVSAQRARA